MIDADEVLLLAANTGRVADMMFALQRGANPNAQDGDGHFAIHLAALSDNPLAVELLVQHRAEIDATNDESLTPFQLAIDGRMYLSAEALVQCGCATDQEWPDRSTAVHKAVAHNRIVLLAALLINGAQVNRRNNSGRSPLVVAAELEQLTSLRMLLTHGANLADLSQTALTPEIRRAVTAWRAGMMLAAHA